MTSYGMRDDIRDGSLPAIRSQSGILLDQRRVSFEDESRYSRPRSPRLRAESPLINPRPPSPGGSQRRQLQDMQEQMKSFRDELQKKDSLIQQLVSMEAVPKVSVRSQADSVRTMCAPDARRIPSLSSREGTRPPGTIYHLPDSYMHLESMYLGDRTALETARTELAQLQVRNEKQQNKIRELENELEIRDVRIKEIQLMNETSHENECRLQTIVDSLRGQMTELEGRAGAFESVAGRSEFTVAALQKESKTSQERIVELEARQRKLLEEREEAQARVESLDRRMREYFTQFGSILRLESLTGGAPTLEEITTRLTEHCEENALLKGKLLTLTETLNNSELETKASRETIMRLVSEMGREQQLQTKYSSELDQYRSRSRERCRSPRSILKSPTRNRDRSHSRERDIERQGRADLQREVTLLQERLEASQRTIEAQRSELHMRDGRMSQLERERRSVSTHEQNAVTQLTLFREQLANLLSEVDGSVHSTEDSIRRKIESLVYAGRDARNKYESLEERVKQLTEQLEHQYDLHKAAASRARKAECDAAEFQKRMQAAEGELAAGDVMRDGFRSDKEQYMRCLQQLGEVMKMDRISLDLGMEMSIEALVARAAQLVKLEKDTLADRSTHIYNLQRKVKSLKEQLESKDLHIDLLRKKVTSLEEKVLGRSTLERERDSESLRVRKTEKLAEKYRARLEDAHQEITNLKAQLLGSSELRVRTLEQRKEVEELAVQVEELERLRKKQAKKIHELKGEVDCSHHSSQEKSVVADNAVQALTSELRTTKAALQAIQNREKQLIDFRNVVARMLGLDINTLAIPDYEIITRLEKLINAHHSHTFTTLSLEEALVDMEDGFYHGYQDYKNTVGASESQDIRKSRERVKRKALRARARSMSPTRRVTGNPKVY